MRSAPRRGRVVLAAAAGLVVVATTATPSAALPPAGGTCQLPWTENTTLVNPEDPGFFSMVDKNGDGVICIKDWRGPDPDPDVGFLAIDNMVRPRG